VETIPFARKWVCAVGAQAGEAKLREVIAGGCRNVRRAAETPYKMILEYDPQSRGTKRHCADR
jgi:hypothetical protein